MNGELPSLQPAPLVVAITAHRNLVPAEIPSLRNAIREIFLELRRDFPHTPLTLMSPLAEGGGRIAAQVAIELGLQLVVPIPLPLDLYMADFANEESRDEFTRLAAAGTLIEMPLYGDNTLENIADYGLPRNQQYAQLGIYLSSHSQILLACWDGKPLEAMGGTSQVVHYHLTDTMPGMTLQSATYQQLLGSDENDLVCHIVCSRDQPDGEPAAGLKPLDVRWLTSYAENSTTDRMRDRNRRVFLRMDEFNAEAKKHWGRIATHPTWLRSKEIAAEEPGGRLAALFRIADWLADRYQRRVLWMFRWTYSVAVGMGLSFIAYSDLPSQDHMIYVFVTLFALGFIVYKVAQRGQWHRKYLDYRALAEGLRVQYYWQVAGITKGSETQFAHDNFLQKQDIELGWIRNVMRAGSICPDIEPSGVELSGVIQHWVGDANSGQLNYYSRKATEREQLSRLTQTIGLACLWTGIAIAGVLAIFPGYIAADTRDPLIVLMGVLPLIAAIREAYAHKKAEKELVKQYRFMEQIFGNASRQIAGAGSDEEKRAVLKALGEAALDEHAEWILMHRERPLEHSRL